MNPETTEPISELELFLDDTNALAVQDQKRAALIATLKPIASGIGDLYQYSIDVRVTDESSAKKAAEVRDHMLSCASLAETAIREFDGNLLGRLFNAHRKGTALIARFTVLNEYARTVKQKILRWQQDEADKAEKERQRLQAIVDEKARVEKERLEKLAEKRVTPEVKEKYREQAAAVVAPVVFVAPPTKAVSAQKRWRVKAVDMTLMGIPPSVQGYVEIKISNLERAKAANSMLEVPGVSFHQVLV